MRTFLRNTHTIHTGEFAGLASRIVAMLASLGLLTMAGLGACLWWTRRHGRLAAPLLIRMASP